MQLSFAKKWRTEKNVTTEEGHTWLRYALADPVLTMESTTIIVVPALDLENASEITGKLTAITVDVITGGVWWAGHVIDAPQVEENVKKKKKRKKSGDSGFVSQWTMNIYNTIFEKKVGRQIKALHEPKNWYFSLVPREKKIGYYLLDSIFS